MVSFNILTTLVVTLAASFTAASPVALAEANTSPNLLSPRFGFQYRFYNQGNCDHNAAAGNTWPRNDGGPAQGQSGGPCYSAPVGTNWQRLEIDIFINGGSTHVITFCNVGCQGAGSALQSGTNCYVPVPGCAIGSFKIT